MTPKEAHIDSELQKMIEEHNTKIQAIYDRHTVRSEWFTEIMNLLVGGYVVIYLLLFAYEIISRLPPYVQP